ncbi:MAG: MFS transporter, partial [Treponema sp.]|nr:MFS transporter [Treponema sp.]
MNRNRSTQAYVSLVFFVMFIYGINNQAVGTLITRIIAHYNIRMAQAGLLPSFASAGNFAAIFAVTVFAGRVNKTILMGASLFFWAVSLYLISTAPPFAVILACFALIGIFAATTDTLVNSLVADLMPDHVSRSLSILHGIFGVGGLCGPIVIERLAE